MLPTPRAACAGAFAALVTACGAAGAPAISPGGDGDEARRARSTPVQLELLDAEGTRISLRELRAKPLLLFLFATYDNTSQAALDPLLTFWARHRELQLLGVALQPDAEMFLPPYASSLSIPFTLAYDPDNTILQGQSDLGAVDRIPTYILLDASGRIVARREGPALQRDLEALLAQLDTR